MSKLQQDKEESSLYKKEIERLYEEAFSDKKYKKIFNKKIFTMIDLLIELNEKNLNGQFKLRVQKLINSSLKLYIINLDSAAKMIKASSLDIDFEKEIIGLLNENKEIIKKLKEFVTKIILIDINDNNFSSLINSFERSLTSLDIIKDIRGASNEL